mmetsp:Transcript_39766/g.124212  ORF Transcript_39766/g.124212 Transcript_39766/m.124212 type:complete len:386 (+) Transcript_39766:3944-5101(+)
MSSPRRMYPMPWLRNCGARLRDVSRIGYHAPSWFGSRMMSMRPLAPSKNSVISSAVPRRIPAVLGRRTCRKPSFQRCCWQGDVGRMGTLRWATRSSSSSTCEPRSWKPAGDSVLLTMRAVIMTLYCLFVPSRTSASAATGSSTLSMCHSGVSMSTFIAPQPASVCRMRPPSAGLSWKTHRPPSFPSGGRAGDGDVAGELAHAFDRGGVPLSLAVCLCWAFAVLRSCGGLLKHLAWALGVGVGVASSSKLWLLGVRELMGGCAWRRSSVLRLRRAMRASRVLGGPSPLGTDGGLAVFGLVGFPGFASIVWSLSVRTALGSSMSGATVSSSEFILRMTGRSLLGAFFAFAPGGDVRSDVISFSSVMMRLACFLMTFCRLETVFCRSS